MTMFRAPRTVILSAEDGIKATKKQIDMRMRRYGHVEHIEMEDGRGTCIVSPR